jgi:hypothetical protein
MGNDLPKLQSSVASRELRVAGEAPCSREAAAAVALSSTELLLFGGGSGGGCVRAYAAQACATLHARRKPP